MGRVDGGSVELLLGSTGMIALALIARPANAAPQQPVVTGGQSTITQSGNTTTVVQTTQRSSINWQSFSIAPNEQVVFQQPNSSSISLDRVTGATASTIGGTLTANGQVVLINANGVLFAPGASVNLAGLIATTSDIADGDFLAGKMNFSQASSVATATVVNKGTIDIASGGYAVLSAAAVENDGVIQAKLGSVVLAGATAFTLDFTGDGLLQYTVTQGVNSSPGTQTLVEQAGTITADGSQVLLTARAAQGVIQHVINMDGVIEANSITRASDGKLVVGAIALDGGSVGTVGVSGQVAGSALSVSGASVSFAPASLDVPGSIVVIAGDDQVSTGDQITSAGTLALTSPGTIATTNQIVVATTVQLTDNGQSGVIATSAITGSTAGPTLTGGPTLTTGPTITSGPTVISGSTLNGSQSSTVITSVETFTGSSGVRYSLRLLSQCELGSACAPTLTALLSGSNAGAVSQAANYVATIGATTEGLSARTPFSSELVQPSGTALIPGLLTDQTRPSRAEK